MNYKCLKTYISGNYLGLRRVKQADTLRYDTIRNFKVYTGYPVLMG
jgi:hypothetical protein